MVTLPGPTVRQLPRPRAASTGTRAEPKTTVVAVVRGGQQVHRRRADEPGHEEVRRVAVQRVRLATCCMTP